MTLLQALRARGETSLGAGAFLLAFPLAGPTVAQDAVAAPLAFVENTKLPPGFLQVETARADGSAARIFLGGTGVAAEEPRPLWIYVEGSGAQSLFYELDDGRIAMGMFGLMAGHVGDEYHVAAIEKRGVEFGEMGAYGAATEASEEYAAHATLSNRAADVRLLVDTLLLDPRFDPARVVLVGHSEGADVVAAAAADNPAVTHVAFLSGGGPMQLYDMFLLQRKGSLEHGSSPEDTEASITELENQIRDLLADPDSTTKMFMGHAYKRWSTFATQAPADSLVRARGRIFLAHGSADQSVPIESFDYLVVRLLIAGRDDVTIRRYPGRDHSFMDPSGEPGHDGFLEVLDEVRAWAASN